MRRVFGIAWKVARTGVVVVVVLLVAAAAGTLLLRSQGKELYAVQSGSMEPVFGRGDAVLLAKTFDALERGDIISFHSKEHGVIITHRIIDADERAGRYVTKGDSSAMPDQPIARSAVIGKVEYRLPFVGYGLDFLRQPLGLVLAVYVPALAIVFSEVRKLGGHYARRTYHLHGYLIR